MNTKFDLPQSITYLGTGALLIYQFLWELTHCCRDGIKLQELIKFFNEGRYFLLLLFSGSLLLISGFLRLRNQNHASVMAIIATLIGFGYYISGYSLMPVSLLLIFLIFRLELLIIVLSGVMLLISFIISTREVIQLLRNKDLKIGLLRKLGE